MSAHDVIDQDYIKLYGDGKLIELPNAKPGAYVWRDKVCSMEIWKVMMKRDDQPQQHHLRKIDKALRNTSYCGQSKSRHRFGEGIGRQYGFGINLISYYQGLKAKNKNNGTTRRLWDNGRTPSISCGSKHYVMFVPVSRNFYPKLLK